MDELTLDQLRAELAEYAQPAHKSNRSPHEERIVAGFEDVQRFFDQRGRAPQHGEDKDILERLYAIRLDRLRTLEECRTILIPLDHQGLLAGAETTRGSLVEIIDDNALRAELEGAAGIADITKLQHVRSSAEKRAAEEIANRRKCEDFDSFRPLFKAVQNDLDSGARITSQIRRGAGFLKTDIKQGEFFIVGGQIAHVAEVGQPFAAPNGETDARLRVIYSNGTESDLLLRSLQRALYKDDTSRLVTEFSVGPLFSGESADGDLSSGTVYVLRSASTHPLVVQHREVLHKIGVTGGDVARRIANAKLDPTFLMSDVEVVATYELFNINRTRLEQLIHRVFSTARLEIEIKDRFGQPVVPREWFLVPLFVVDEAITRVRDGSITSYAYDPQTAGLVRVDCSISTGGG